MGLAYTVLLGGLAVGLINAVRQGFSLGDGWHLPSLPPFQFAESPARDVGVSLSIPESTAPAIPLSPTQMMPAATAATVQGVLLGTIPVSPWAIPGGNPLYIPAELSDWAPLPSYLEGQVADYNSPTGRYIWYNGSRYWVN
jgi:hypothetical protein